ncbi:unnamed protein product [Symbiodinium natans]|uniref:Uncharacterized protein n=1 Tax=Symbiodinium natans TaxID=878477 RepID=A0A812N3V5_9DINO|nr:unnamed protein product [Symbiodinium natans]
MGLHPDIDALSRNRDAYVGHPYAFRLFAMMVCNLLIFKMNSAYQRYWEAAGALQSMATKWLDGACMAISFDAGGDPDHPYLNGSEWQRSSDPDPSTCSKGGPDHAEYVKEVLHLCSLLHAVTLQHLRRDENLDNLVPAAAGPRHTILPKSPSFWSERSMFSADHISDLYKILRLPVLGGLRPEEKEALMGDSKGQSLPTCARAAMVEGWFMRRLICRQKHEQGETSKTSPPILSRLYQVISDGTLWSSTAAKSSEIPFPFPYQNFVEVLVWLFSFMAPVVINGIIFEQFLRTAAVFTVVLCFHTLKNTADVMEDPYLPYDPNDLPLVSWQRSVNARLLCFGHVPQDEAESIHEVALDGDPDGLSLQGVKLSVGTSEAKLQEESVSEAPVKLPQGGQQGSVSASCLECLPVTFGIAHLHASHRSRFA